jgi:hypothetical protein
LEGNRCKGRATGAANGTGIGSGSEWSWWWLGVLWNWRWLSHIPASFVSPIDWDWHRKLFTL